MRRQILGLMAALVGLALAADSAWACNLCHRPTCSGVPVCQYVPQPAYQCVTEMVPYTVTQTRMRMELKPENFTVMTQVPETTWIEKTCMVCRPVIETKPVEQRYTICRPVTETTYVDQTYTVCRPVTTTRQVTECCLQPTTQVVAVPAAQPCAMGCGGCGLGLLCGKKHGLHGCGGLTPTGCQYVTQTCYTPVPVTRTICETQMVPETQVRKVPVTTCHYVTEEKVTTVNITCCRIETVPEVRKFPVVTIKCVPETRTRMVPICVPEQVTTTCYRPVTRMVPIAPAVPCCGGAVTPAEQAPSAQAPSGQSPKAEPPGNLTPAPPPAPPVPPAPPRRERGDPQTQDGP